jgi:hypothetical protein
MAIQILSTKDHLQDDCSAYYIKAEDREYTIDSYPYSHRKEDYMCHVKVRSTVGVESRFKLIAVFHIKKLHKPFTTY